MTIQEFEDNLNFDLQLHAIAQGFALAVKDVLGAQIVRIFEEGKNSSGGDIGTYNDTRPLYVAGTGTHKGKPNKEGKSKKIKTTYYESYKAYRNIKGREDSFVNLRFHGRLMSDMANAPLSEGIPTDVEPKKVNDFEYEVVLRGESINKRKGMEKKFGKIFDLTKGELERYNRTLEFEIFNRLQNLEVNA